MCWHLTCRRGFSIQGEEASEDQKLPPIFKLLRTSISFYHKTSSHIHKIIRQFKNHSKPLSQKTVKKQHFEGVPYNDRWLHNAQKDVEIIKSSIQLHIRRFYFQRNKEVKEWKRVFNGNFRSWDFLTVFLRFFRKMPWIKDVNNRFWITNCRIT